MTAGDRQRVDLPPLFRLGTRPMVARSRFYMHVTPIWFGGHCGLVRSGLSEPDNPQGGSAPMTSVPRKVVLCACALAAIIISRAVLTGQSSGPISTQSPYALPSVGAVETTSIITVGDTVGGYRMVGIPDGLGAFDNGDGTLTLLMNHELGNAAGVNRAHGSRGSFVSKWIINKSDLKVLSGGDLMQKIFAWDTATQHNAASSS